MKNSFIILSFALLLGSAASAQDTQLQSLVTRIDQSTTAKDFQQLANEFGQLTEQQPDNWLNWYYAAFCNAKIGWLYMDDGDRIEPFANKADEQIKKAYSLLDTSKQKKELSEVTNAKR